MSSYQGTGSPTRIGLSFFQSLLCLCGVPRSWPYEKLESQVNQRHVPTYKYVVMLEKQNDWMSVMLSPTLCCYKKYLIHDLILNIYWNNLASSAMLISNSRQNNFLNHCSPPPLQDKYMIKMLASAGSVFLKVQLGSYRVWIFIFSLCKSGKRA